MSDKASFELARAGLGIFSEQVGEDYLQLRKKLTSSLGVMGVENYAHQVEDERANLELVSSFAAALPHATHLGTEEMLGLTREAYKFTVPDQAQARFIQHSTFWAQVNDKPGRLAAYYPYYIVGYREREWVGVSVCKERIYCLSLLIATGVYRNLLRRRIIRHKGKVKAHC